MTAASCSYPLTFNPQIYADKYTNFTTNTEISQHVRPETAAGRHNIRKNRHKYFFFMKFNSNFVRFLKNYLNNKSI